MDCPIKIVADQYRRAHLIVDEAGRGMDYPYHLAEITWVGGVRRIEPHPDLVGVFASSEDPFGVACALCEAAVKYVEEEGV